MQRILVTLILQIAAKARQIWAGYVAFMEMVTPQNEIACQVICGVGGGLLLALTGSAAPSAPPLVIGASSVQDAFKQNRARQHVIVGGGLILVCITLLSCVSSFMIYREGFSDTPSYIQNILSLFAVAVVEGAFIWLVYGFTRAFASSSERLISLSGMCFLVGVMLTNIITHFMIVKHIPMSAFQEAWLSWGAVSVFIGVLIIVLLITLSDPVTRLIRLELRYLGKQQETIIQAKTDGLDSEHIQAAMEERAEIEARQLASWIVGGAGDDEPRPKRVGKHSYSNFDGERRPKKSRR